MMLVGLGGGTHGAQKMGRRLDEEEERLMFVARREGEDFLAAGKLNF